MKVHIRFRLNIGATIEIPEGVTADTSLRLYCAEELKMPLKLLKCLSIDSVEEVKE